MDWRLGPYQYLFRMLYERQAGGLTLNMSVCPPFEEHSTHTHVNPGITISLGGDYYESFEGVAVALPFLAARWRPAEVPHSHTVGPGGARALHIEFDSQWLQGQCEDSAVVRTWAASNHVLCQTICLRLTLAVASGDRREPLDEWTLDLLSCLGPSEPHAGRRPKWLRRARDYVEDNAVHGTKLSDVAREVGISPMHLAATFRQHYGESISIYQRRLRLLRAAADVEGASSLGQVAIASGFYDQAHFCRAFRSEFGAQPKTMTSLHRSLNRAMVQAMRPCPSEQ